MKIHEKNGYKICEFERSNIFIFENILNPTTCEKLVENINKLPLNKIGYYPGNNVKCYNIGIKKLMNIDDELYYPFSTNTSTYEELLNNVTDKKIHTNLLNGVSKSDMKSLSDIIYTAIDTINADMKTMCDVSVDVISELNFRKIYGETRIHSDGTVAPHYSSDLHFIKQNNSNDIVVRSLTYVFCLNDDYDGGEFNFPYYNLSVRLLKGSVIVFPPFWTHKHAVNELKNNTYRYTVTAWGCEFMHKKL